MDFDKKIVDGNITIYCSDLLYEFAKEFLKYYKKENTRIKSIFDLNDEYPIIFALFSDIKVFDNIPYKNQITSFSGFFNDTGVVAYVEQGGTYSDLDLYKRLMHETVHYLYKNFVYGKENERITWVDEGLACFLSNQYSGVESKEAYAKFLNDNLVDVDLNKLNHEDESFGNNNGYNLSYMAIRYLYEHHTKEEFLSLIKDEERLKDIGKTVLKEIK